MKKTLLGIAGILAIISVANAADTDKIKVACQSSDKTLWVERNQVCIPRNPCDNSKYEQYCNRDFKDVESRHYLTFRNMIDLYAETHNLSCKSVNTESKLVGQDYVVCMGDDVMVFEYNDISDNSLIPSKSDIRNVAKGFCLAAGGKLLSDVEYGYNCGGLNESLCKKLSAAVGYGFEWAGDGRKFSGAVWKNDTRTCVIKTEDYRPDVHNLYEYDPSYDPSNHYYGE